MPALLWASHMNQRAACNRIRSPAGPLSSSCAPCMANCGSLIILQDPQGRRRKCPASCRNGVRLRLGTLSGFKSESASGFVGIPIYTMSMKNSFSVCERIARCRHRSAQCCTGAVRPSSGSSAYARWSSSGPRCRWSSSEPRRRRSSPRWSFGRTCRWPSAPWRRGRACARVRRWPAPSRWCWRIAWSRARRAGQFSRHRGSRRGLQRQRLHSKWLHQPWLWPWLPALALCGGCGLRLWRILCLRPTTAATTCPHTGDTAPRRVLVCHGN